MFSENAACVNIVMITTQAKTLITNTGCDCDDWAFEALIDVNITKFSPANGLKKQQDRLQTKGFP